jgi:hypothetical protein
MPQYSLSASRTGPTPAGEDEADGHDRGTEADDQRPPGLRAEKALFRIRLVDLVVLAVLQAGIHTFGCVQGVEGDEERQAAGEQQQGGAHLVAAEVPVGTTDAGIEDETEDERPAFDLHQAPSWPRLAELLICGCERALGGASLG